MTVQLDFHGASGSDYRFFLIEQQAVSPTGGNFIYARQSPDGLAVLLVGEAENLSVLARERWPEAQSQWGATHLFIRLNVTAAMRRREQQDLVEAYAPPMNVAPEA